MRRCLVVLLIVGFGLIGSANADIKKGATELAIFGNWTGINFESGAAGDADYEDSGALAVGLGYFHTRQIEFGVHGMGDRKSTRLNSSHAQLSRMPSSA